MVIAQQLAYLKALQQQQLRILAANPVEWTRKDPVPGVDGLFVVTIKLRFQPIPIQGVIKDPVQPDKISDDPFNNANRK